MKDENKLSIKKLNKVNGGLHGDDQGSINPTTRNPDNIAVDGQIFIVGESVMVFDKSDNYVTCGKLESYDYLNYILYFVIDGIRYFWNEYNFR